jgi:hypothetical protein
MSLLGLRDFWRRSIFDFFDSIDPNRTSAANLGGAPPATSMVG